MSIHLLLVYVTRTVMISSLSVPVHSHVVHVMPCMCRDISCQLIFAMNMRIEVFSTFKYDLLLNILAIWYSEYSDPTKKRPFVLCVFSSPFCQTELCVKLLESV